MRMIIFKRLKTDCLRSMDQELKWQNGQEVILIDMDNPFVYKKRRGIDGKLEPMEKYKLVKEEEQVQPAVNLEEFVRQEEIQSIEEELQNKEVDLQKTEEQLKQKEEENRTKTEESEKRYHEVQENEAEITKLTEQFTQKEDQWKRLQEEKQQQIDELQNELDALNNKDRNNNETIKQKQYRNKYVNQI